MLATAHCFALVPAYCTIVTILQANSTCTCSNSNQCPPLLQLMLTDTYTAPTLTWFKYAM